MVVTNECVSFWLLRSDWRKVTAGHPFRSPDIYGANDDYQAAQSPRHCTAVLLL